MCEFCVFFWVYDIFHPVGFFLINELPYPVHYHQTMETGVEKIIYLCVRRREIEKKKKYDAVVKKDEDE